MRRMRYKYFCKFFITFNKQLKTFSLLKIEKCVKSNQKSESYYKNLTISLNTINES